MTDVYKSCPQFENTRYLLRYVAEEDCAGLQKVYSDLKAVPLFNSDNCGGDDFYYTTLQRMKEAIEYWHFEYNRRGFVRWSVIDQLRHEAIGTIELFHRNSEDFFTNCGLLRLDLRSDYERASDIQDILSLIIPSSFQLFDCDKVATKATPHATERIHALDALGFRPTDQKLIGHGGKAYDAYFVLQK